jgi:hypothetical protein
MMRPSLIVTKQFVESESQKLESIIHDMASFPTRNQYLVSEIILIRLAAVFEHALAEIAYKIVAGALYCDGSSASLLHSCNSVSASRSAMLTVGRQRQAQWLKWTRSKFIKESTQFVIDPSDHYRLRCNVFGPNLAEIFKVRNFAAHRTPSARIEFNEVVLSIYGRRRKLQIGQFLLSTNLVQVPNINRYFIEVRSIINDLVKA